MILFPSILLLLPSLSLAVPLPLDQEVSTYIRGYNYKMPFSDGSRINFSRYYNSQTPGLPPVAPPLDAVVVEAKHQRQGKAVVFPSNANVNDNTNCLGYSMLGCV